MKRGLKHNTKNRGTNHTPSPNPGPDEEGIETRCQRFLWLLPDRLRPNPGPDEEGIETDCRPVWDGIQSVRPNPGPDEEGIETKRRWPAAKTGPGPNPGPDEEGIETFNSLQQIQEGDYGPNPGPDEEGIETY